MIRSGSILVAVLVSPAPLLAQETWAGHQVVYGHRDIPFVGRIDFRTDSFVVARVQRYGQYIELEQTPCQIDFSEALGVKIAMDKQTLRKLPPAVVRFQLLALGKARSDSWFVGWGGEDLDGDGKPGVTVDVDAPLCGGSLYVANGSTSLATARLTEGGMVGDVWVHVQQEVLDASNFCLSWFSAETNERQTGTFAYQKVDDGATCESLASRPWPVEAPSAEVARADKRTEKTARKD